MFGIRSRNLPQSATEILARRQRLAVVPPKYCVLGHLECSLRDYALQLFFIDEHAILYRNTPYTSDILDSHIVFMRAPIEGGGQSAFRKW
jgi:hypothetical protein